jgi:hypothetical protein
MSASARVAVVARVVNAARLAMGIILVLVVVVRRGTVRERKEEPVRVKWRRDV